MTDYSHDIEKYLKGELTPAERNALERKALHDPFLADALEGAEQIKPTEFFNDVADLNKKIATIKITPNWMWPARIAAGLAIVAVSTFIIWSLVETTPPHELALEKSEPAEQPSVVADSVPETSTLSSPPVEQPAAGPTIREKDLATRSMSPAKTETKPKQTTAGETEVKNEPVTEPLAVERAEEKADELKVAESLAKSKTIEKEEAAVSRAKAADDQQERKAGYKKAASDRDATPAAADKAAGYASSISPNVIRGQVTSAEDGSALPGVNVIIKGSTIGTVTNEQGNYEVTVPHSNPTLVYSFIGLQSKEVNAADRQEVDVQLTQDAMQLSEVVTTAYGVESGGSEFTPTVDLAHPEIGNRAFKQYLERSIQYPEQAKTNKVSGRVTVEFTIEPNGSLSNFTIIRGIGSGCDEELIRLIKEGPRWIPTKRDNIPVQDKAKVRLRFELPR